MTATKDPDPNTLAGSLPCFQDTLTSHETRWESPATILRGLRVSDTSQASACPFLTPHSRPHQVLCEDGVYVKEDVKGPLVVDQRMFILKKNHVKARWTLL